MNRDENSMMKPVSLEQLLREETAHVDLYVQLSEKKFVMVAKAGTQTASLARYRDRKVQYLHLRYDDLTKLLHHSMTVAGVMLNKDNLSDSAKVVALEQALSSVYRNFDNFGFNEQTVSHAKVVTEATMTMCLGHSELQKIIAQMSHLQNPLHRHSLLVSALCSMLGVAMGYTVPATLEKLALGGFLLDIGKTKLPQDIVGKRVERLQKGETEIYKSHVDLGLSMAQLVRDIPHDVTLMIYEHHEHADGSGYPRKIKDLMMSPLGRVAVVANAFAENISLHGTSPTSLDIEGVVNHMCTRASHLYNRDVLKALRMLVNQNTLAVAS
jgi:HD-GYP domain-containing protein (c-di-GMP phosphodiesterase class II)